MPSDTFYVVGNPIACTTSERGFLQSDVSRIYRKDITAREIMVAFPKEGNIKFFSTKEDALEYSRYLREGDDFFDVIKQPAIYKIEIDRDLRNQSVISETLVINLDSATYARGYDNIKRVSTIKYYEVDICTINIDKIEAEFKIHDSDWDKDKGKYHVLHLLFSCNDKDLSELYLKEEQILTSQQRYKFFKSMAVKTFIITAGGLTAAAACYVYNHADISVSFKN